MSSDVTDDNRSVDNAQNNNQTENVTNNIPEPQKQFTLQEILAAMAQELKQLQEKAKNFDRFREDVLAQMDTFSNVLHEKKLDTAPTDGNGGSSAPSGPMFTPESIKGMIDSINGLATNAFDMIYKWKVGTLADPMDQKRMEYGDRVVRRLANEEISHTVKEVKKPDASKYEGMYVNDHGHSKNIR